MDNGSPYHLLAQATTLKPTTNYILEIRKTGNVLTKDGLDSPLGWQNKNDINDLIVKNSDTAIYKLVAPKECPMAASNGPYVVFMFLIVSKNSGIIVVFPEDLP